MRKFSGKELAEDIRRWETLPRISLRHGFAFVVSGEAAQQSYDRFQLPVAELVDHGFRGFLERITIHALIVAHSAC